MLKFFKVVIEDYKSFIRSFFRIFSTIEAK